MKPSITKFNIGRKSAKYFLLFQKMFFLIGLNDEKLPIPKFNILIYNTQNQFPFSFSQRTNKKKKTKNQSTTVKSTATNLETPCSTIVTP